MPAERASGTIDRKFADVRIALCPKMDSDCSKHINANNSNIFFIVYNFYFIIFIVFVRA
jgi:hypothetical protein